MMKVDFAKIRRNPFQWALLAVGLVGLGYLSLSLWSSSHQRAASLQGPGGQIIAQDSSGNFQIYSTPCYRVAVDKKYKVFPSAGDNCGLVSTLEDKTSAFKIRNVQIQPEAPGSSFSKLYARYQQAGQFDNLAMQQVSDDVYIVSGVKKDGGVNLPNARYSKV
jgi:hypothetical protein